MVVVFVTIVDVIFVDAVTTVAEPFAVDSVFCIVVEGIVAPIPPIPDDGAAAVTIADDIIGLIVVTTVPIDVIKLVAGITVDTFAVVTVSINALPSLVVEVIRLIVDGIGVFMAPVVIAFTVVATTLLT